MKIFVAAGTKDGRELAGYLLGQGHSVTASVVTEYGQSLLEEYQGIQINHQPLDLAGFVEYFGQHQIELFVDASHPYAVNASANAIAACHQVGIPYIRYERKVTPVDYEQAYYVADYQSAAARAAELGYTIFLTTGSRQLEIFAKAPELKNKKLICRILPEPQVISQARELGFRPDAIVAMQGPFSVDMNKELFKHYQTQVVVTKDSGNTGGTDSKVLAAKELNLPLVIIGRPEIPYDNKVDTYEKVLEYVQTVANN